MKLVHYGPTGRWVLASPIIEEKVGGLYIPDSLRDSTGETPRFKVIMTGPEVTICKEGQIVLIEPGTRVMEIRFEETKANHPVQFLEYSIMGIDNV